MTVAGRCGIPATARALVLNLTVVQPTAAGYLTLYPANFPVPATSTLNYRPGQSRANNATIALGAGGALAVRNAQASGTAHAILDVTGYFE